MKILKMIVAFWGLTRNMAATVESIERIRASLPNHIAFAHTYHSNSAYMNRRAGECSINIVPDLERLRADHVEVEDLDEVRRKIGLLKYRTNADPWKTNYETMDNFILAMHSRRRVTEMIQQSGIQVEKVVFMRPDLRYASTINKDMLDKDGWVIPNFHLYNGFNDRFCIASKETFPVYGNMFKYLMPYSIMYPLHSETVHAYIAKAMQIRVHYANFKFQRIRMDGSVEKRDIDV